MTLRSGSRLENKRAHTMTRWFVGVNPGGRREVVAESTGINPTAQLRGYVDMCGPYRTQKQAANAARCKPSPDRSSLRHRP